MLRILQKWILTALFAVFASQASAMFIQPDWLDPTEPGVGTNRYSYSGNDPINKLDPGGNRYEIAKFLEAVGHAATYYGPSLDGFTGACPQCGIVTQPAKAGLKGASVLARGVSRLTGFRVPKSARVSNVDAAIDAYRSENKITSSKGGDGVVALTNVDAEVFFGVNSTNWSSEARELMTGWRKELGLPAGGSRGQYTYHAEANALVNAYEATGGRLPERMVMYVDSNTCPMCQSGLPNLVGKLGIENLLIYSAKVNKAGKRKAWQVTKDGTTEFDLDDSMVPKAD